MALKGNELCMRLTALHQKDFFKNLLRPFTEKIALQTFNKCKVFSFPLDLSFRNTYNCESLKTFYFTRSILNRSHFL